MERFKIYNRRYLGSKYKLLEFIEKIVEENTENSKVFLDLFAGSGAIGIEALSRGANKAVFIEKNKMAVKCINENLIHTRLNDRANVICGDVLSILKSHRLHDRFDIIFLDPPYGDDIYLSVLNIIKENNLLNQDGFVIMECDSRDIVRYSDVEGYIVDRVKDYKNIAHIFLKGA